MKKPQKTTKSCYNYLACRDYLQEKYNYEERDYLGKLKGNNNKPYLDFWHWIVDNYEIHNGCFITFTRDRIQEI